MIPHTGTGPRSGQTSPIIRSRSVLFPATSTPRPPAMRIPQRPIDVPRDSITLSTRNVNQYHPSAGPPARYVSECSQRKWRSLHRQRNRPTLPAWRRRRPVQQQPARTLTIAAPTSGRLGFRVLPLRRGSDCLCWRAPRIRTTTTFETTHRADMHILAAEYLAGQPYAS